MAVIPRPFEAQSSGGSRDWPRALLGVERIAQLHQALRSKFGCASAIADGTATFSDLARDEAADKSVIPFVPVVIAAGRGAERFAKLVASVVGRDHLKRTRLLHPL